MTCNSPPLTHWASKRIIDKPQQYLSELNWAHWCFPISDNAQNLRPDYYSSLEKAWEGKRALIARFVKGERIPVFVGIPRFNLDQLDVMRQRAIDPPFRGLLQSTADNPLHVKLVANPDGWVKIWRPPQAGHQYVIGFDSAAGIDGGDFLSAHVLDREDESICAAWHGHIEPEKFGNQELKMLGYLYNRAMIGGETFPSAHGLATALALTAIGYPRVYYHKSLDMRSKRQQKLGWSNDSKSKPLMVDGIATHLETNPEIPDRELINEMMSFGVMENGSCQAQEGSYDDRTISFGVALVVNKFSGIAMFYGAQQAAVSARGVQTGHQSAELRLSKGQAENMAKNDMDARAELTFRQFTELARRRNFSAQSLAQRFRGRIQEPSEFFSRVLSGKFPNTAIPYRSVIDFYLAAQAVAPTDGRPTCVCGCGRPVFDRKKWALPGCRTKVQRETVRNRQFWLGQLIDFVKPKLRQNRRVATYPLTEGGNANLS